MPRTARQVAEATLPRTEVKKRNVPRAEDNLERAYGSPEQREWLTSHPCWWCERRGFKQLSRTEQAHMATGGMGIKAGADTNLPLCREHHVMFDEYEDPFLDCEVRQEMLEAAKELYRESPDFIANGANV